MEMSLSPSKRFRVSPDGRDDALFGPNWRFSFGYYQTDNPYEALRFLADCQPVSNELAALLSPLAHSVSMSNARFSGFEPVIPEDMELMAFQKAGVRYALDREHTLIGDEPGLGKTAQALAIGNTVSARRTLIVCPAGVRFHWRDETLAWAVVPSAVRPTPWVVRRAADGLHPRASHVIISYDLCRDRGFQRVLSSCLWDHLIIDEAHYLKTPASQRTRAIFGTLSGERRPHISAAADRITALTGTPLPNRPRECYTLARSLCWESIDWLSMERFLSRYNPTNFASPLRLDELRLRLRSYFMARRRKYEVMPQLPRKTYRVETVTASGAVGRVVRAERELVGCPETYKELLEILKARGLAMGHLATLRRELGEAMAPVMASLVADRLDGGVFKIGVFAHHIGVIEMLKDKLSEFEPVCITGSTTMPQRHEAVRRFVRDAGCRVFIGQLQAAGTGVDGLQHAASEVVIVEPSWVPGENEQCVDRFHRIGQERAVTATFLVAEGSLTERILRTSAKKALHLRIALDAPSNVH